MKNKQNNLADLFQKDNEPFSVFSAPINQAHRATINADFQEVYQFAEIVEVLDNAEDGDVVQLKLSTNGGTLHSIIPMINAMKNTMAHVHIHVESDTSSAGTILMVLADSCYVNEYVTCMLHTANYSFGGHSGNMDAHVSHATKSIEKLVRDCYTGFLTEQEILRLLDGKEFYFNADDCHERFKIRDALLKEGGSNIEELSEEQLLEQFLKDNPELVEEEKPQKQKRIKVPNTKKSVVE